MYYFRHSFWETLQNCTAMTVFGLEKDLIEIKEYLNFHQTKVCFLIIKSKEFIFIKYLDDCFDFGFDYLGYDVMEQSGIQDFLDCQKLCQENGKCLYWSSHSGKCWLKYSNAGSTVSDIENVVSGPKYCKDECFDFGFDYPGHDIIEHAGIQHFLDCQKLCQENEICQYWTSHSGICYLKQSNVDKTTSYKENCVSGPQHCPISHRQPVGQGWTLHGVCQREG